VLNQARLSGEPSGNWEKNLDSRDERLYRVVVITGRRKGSPKLDLNLSTGGKLSGGGGVEKTKLLGGKKGLCWKTDGKSGGREKKKDTVIY